MTVTLADLQAKVLVDGVQEAIRGLNAVADAFDQTGAQAQKASKPVDDIVVALTKFSIIKTAATNLIGLAQSTIQNYSANERLASSLNALSAKEEIAAGRAQNMTQALANASGRSKELLGWTQQLAIASPFSQDGVAQAFKMAQAYGFVSETASKADIDAKRLTQAMIDFASGSGQSEATMSRIALALGQIKAKGKLAGDEMLQLTEAGLNVRGILADAFGKTTEEIVKMQERGLIPADRAIKAIVESLERDFGGAAKRQAETWAGLLNSLEDIKSVGLREFFTGTFQAIQPLAVDFVNTLSDPKVLESIRGWGQTLGNMTKGSVDALQFLIQNIQALTPVLVGGTAAFIGYKIAANAATITTALNAAATIADTVAGTAYIISLQARALGLRAAAAATWELIGAQGRLIVSLGAVAIAAAAVTAAYMKWREIQAQIDQGVKDTAARTRGWNDSADALDRYNKLTPQLQASSRVEADALSRLRAEQEASIRKYAEMKIAGKNQYESVAQHEANLEKERNAINARSTAIQVQTGILNQHISAQDQEAARIAMITAGHAPMISAADAFTERLRQMTVATKDSADASLIDAKAKEAIKAQTDLLQAKTKLLGDEYLKLNPQINQSGVALAYSRGEITKEVAEYIALILKIQGARNELAQLQAQAGMSPAKKAALDANPGDVGRYITSSQTADPEAGKRAVERLRELRQQEEQLAQAKRNAILTNGTAAQQQKLLNDEYERAKRVYGEASVQAINAKTALDSYNRSLQKTTASGTNKAFNNELKLAVAEQDTAIGKMQVKHDLLVRHLATLKQGSAEYKDTLAQILDLEDKIAAAKEKQRDAVIDIQLAQLDDAKTRRQEERRLRQARNILNSTEFSEDQKAEAADVIARIPLEREKRERDLSRRAREAGLGVQAGTPTAPTTTAALLRPTGAAASGAGQPTGPFGGELPVVNVSAPSSGDGVTVHVYIGDEEIMPRLVRVLRNSNRNVTAAGGAGVG